MMKQCSIIKKQQKYIHELQVSEIKLKKIKECVGENVISQCFYHNEAVNQQNLVTLEKIVDKPL